MQEKTELSYFIHFSAKSSLKRKLFTEVSSDEFDDDDDDDDDDGLVRTVVTVFKLLMSCSVLSKSTTKAIVSYQSIPPCVQDFLYIDLLMLFLILILHLRKYVLFSHWGSCKMQHF